MLIDRRKECSFPPAVRRTGRLDNIPLAALGTKRIGVRVTGSSIIRASKNTRLIVRER